MKHGKLETALMIGICFTLFVGYICVREQSRLAGKLIRLHVIANSDSREDQSLKMEVRDSIVEAVYGLIDGEKDAAKAACIIYENLPYLERKAGEVIKNHGLDYDIKAEFGVEDYDTREYDGFMLPAGPYNSLKIRIGNEAGRNWWCVIFPPLCITAASEFRETAEAAGLTEEEIRLISEKDDDVVFKFRILEIIQKIAGFLKKHF